MRLYITNKFKGVDEGDRESARIGELREKCRAGNPFPLIAAQWPELVLTDPVEIELFNQPMDESRLHSLTPGIIEAVADPSNPPLRLDPWQKIIIAGYFDSTIGEIAVKGCTGAGKGASVSMAFCLWYDAFEESRITLTSRDYSHAVVGIFGEVRKWFMRMRHPSPAKVLGEGISDTQRHYVRVLNPDPSSSTAGEAFSGAHGANTIYGFDEATASPDAFFDNAEKNARKIVMLANPRTAMGRFRNAFAPLGDAIDKIGVCYGTMGNRLCVTISGADCGNVRFGRLKQPVAPLGGIDIALSAGAASRHFREGEPIPPEYHARVAPLIPEQIDLQQFRAICAKPDSREVAVFAHGRFPTEDPTTQVILSSWLGRHEAAFTAGTAPVAECFGLDVARSLDGDNTVLTAGGRTGITGIDKWKFNDTTYHVAEVLRIARERYGIDLARGMNPICVDMDGLGAGVGDQLRYAGVWVIEFRGNATSGVDPRTYGNLRAEAYGTLGRRLSPLDRWKDEPWAIPPDDALRRELVAPQKVHVGGDVLRWRVTPKDELKKLLGYSPDTGDAVVYLFHAVREFASMNAYFAAATGPLVVFPFPPDPKPGEIQAVNGVDRNGSSTLLPPTGDATADLLAYLNAEYGGGAGGRPRMSSGGGAGEFGRSWREFDDGE